MSTSIYDVRFRLHTNFLGRNGTCICSGLSVFHCSSNPSLPYISIMPVTSKGNVGRCSINVPAESVPDVCKAMQTDLLGMVLDQVHGMKQLPALLGLSPVLDAEIEKRLRS